MPKPKLTWNDKLCCSKAPEVKRLDKAFGGMPAGCVMLIASPVIMNDYIRAIPHGLTITVKAMREDLAGRHGAEFTCPVTTGIFLRVVAEAAWESHLAGAPLEVITPFWRVIEPTAPLAAKLACGSTFIVTQRQMEAAAHLERIPERKSHVRELQDACHLALA